MDTATFPADTYASRVFNGRPCHERMVKLSPNHPYEVIGEVAYTTAHSDMLESVQCHSALLIKARKGGVLWIEARKAIQ